MGTFSIWHWLIVLVVVLVLFGGGGKLSKLMGDAGKGINAFKKGLKENKDQENAEGEAEAEVTAQKTIDQEPAAAASSTVDEKDKSAAKG